MSEKAKQTLEKLEQAMKEGKISDFDLGYIFAIAVQNASGEKTCQQ